MWLRGRKLLVPTVLLLVQAAAVRPLPDDKPVSWPGEGSSAAIVHDVTTSD